jgi:hypothetical protein
VFGSTLNQRYYFLWVIHELYFFYQYSFVYNYIYYSFQCFNAPLFVFQDSSFFVRSKFLSKTQKLLKKRKLPIRFACAFALATTESVDNLRFQVCLFFYACHSCYFLLFVFILNCITIPKV